jgi:hypothetical protein
MQLSLTFLPMWPVSITMSTSAVFFDIEKVFDITVHLGLLYKLFKWDFWPTWSSLLVNFSPIGNSELHFKTRHLPNTSRGTTKYNPVPYPVQFVFKWYPPNPRGLHSSLCRSHTHTHTPHHTTHMQHVAKRIIFSESCNGNLTSVETWWNAATWKSMKERLRKFISLIIIDRPRLIVHWEDVPSLLLGM